MNASTNSDSPSELRSPAEMHKQTMRAGIYALLLIAVILVISAVFFVVGISRSAESNYIFKLVTRQHAEGERISALVTDVYKSQSGPKRSMALDALSAGLKVSLEVQDGIKDRKKWGPMDAYDVEVFRQAYLEKPLEVDMHFNVKIDRAYAVLEQGSQKPVLDKGIYLAARDAATNFQIVQKELIKIYLTRIDTVLDQSRVRITSVFIALFVSLVLIGFFLLRPFANRVRNQAEKVERVNLRLKAAAVQDHLTGLPNRAYVTDSLDKEIRIARSNGGTLALAHIDLDMFKEINDTYGHAAGDFLLITFAKRMTALMENSEVVARIGGDEFLIILPGHKKNDALRDKLKSLLSELSRPVDFDGITLRAGGSIGVSLFPNDCESSSDLIVNSDLALYDAKQHGRGSYRFFEKNMRNELALRKKLEGELHSALDKNELEPYLQPQVDLATGKVVGLESLVRWAHPTRGYISPSEFLPVAQSTGEMVRLGRQVMVKAIAKAAELHSAGLEFGRLSLNASIQELREEDFAQWVIETSETYGLPRNKLSIELLETVMVNDLNFDLDNKLEQFRQADIHIELDDFGTGYASLQQVIPGKVSRIKIDRSFIQDIDTDLKNSNIVKSMVSLTSSLGIEIIAEGAETSEEMDTLLEIGCPVIQGHGIAPPMPLDVVSDWLRSFCTKENVYDIEGLKTASN